MLRDAATCQENYRRFVQRVVASGEAWVLSSEAGPAFCESNEQDDTNVILFFSDSAYAKRVQKQSIPGDQLERLDLFNLLYRWLPGMKQDGVLAGTNWTGDLVGLEIAPEELRAELEKQLSQEQRAEFVERFRQELAEQENG